MAVGLRSFELVETREADFGNAAVSRPFSTFVLCYISLLVRSKGDSGDRWVEGV